jgi:Cytidylyltransferase
MKTIAVIPARLASTRLPRKMLLEIDGQPLYLVSTISYGQSFDQMQPVEVTMIINGNKTKYHYYRLEGAFDPNKSLLTIPLDGLNTTLSESTQR